MVREKKFDLFFISEELNQQQRFLLGGVFNVLLSFLSLVSFFNDNSTPQLSQNFTFKSFISVPQLGQFNFNLSHDILFYTNQ